MHHDNTDANGWGYRGGDGHIIGESMPGTTGDAQQILHDREEQVLAVDESIEVPAEETEQCTDTVEDDGVGVEVLVKRLR